MNKSLLALCCLTALSTQVHSQDVYAGLGLPGLYTLGFSQPVASGWGFRGEYSSGLSYSGTGSDNGIKYDASLKASRAGVYADWFPFGSGFRFVGGLTANDIRFNMNSQGTGTASINGNTVNMAGHFFNVSLKYPTTSPYLGIGYGHQTSTKGLGFYADVGVTFGMFTADVNTDLSGVSGSGGAITQADIDAQKQKMNDSLAGFRYLPSVSLGLIYRY
jgi:hypothetical protein